ncbi:MAG: hypothetical protein U9Q82_12420 [Chloroflexota bacterium]|nr:hypothetical protein [Chloroflexota bacterium]
MESDEASFATIGAGAGVAVAVAEAVGVDVGLGVGDAVLEGVDVLRGGGVDVDDVVGVFDPVGEAVIVKVDVAVAVGVADGISISVADGVRDGSLVLSSLAGAAYDILSAANTITNIKTRNDKDTIRSRKFVRFDFSLMF